MSIEYEVFECNCNVLESLLNKRAKNGWELVSAQEYNGSERHATSYVVRADRTCMVIMKKEVKDG